jgi:hypothetical protein
VNFQIALPMSGPTSLTTEDGSIDLCQCSTDLHVRPA